MAAGGEGVRWPADARAVHGSGLRRVTSAATFSHSLCRPRSAALSPTGSVWIVREFTHGLSVHSPMQPAPVSRRDRRAFVKKSCAICVGGTLGAVPVLAGIAVYLDPLHRQAHHELLARVTSLESLPDDGTPVLFPVIATRTDAWNKAVAPIGAVYLRRASPDQVQAFNVTCPHAGCAVEFQPEQEGFLCPCHNSLFSLSGQRSADSPAARDLDSLPAEIRPGGEVWVQFQNFVTGKTEKLAQS